MFVIMNQKYHVVPFLMQSQLENILNIDFHFKLEDNNNNEN